MAPPADGDPEPDAHDPPRRHRRWIWGLAALTLAGALIGAWGLVRSVAQSPAQAVADARPPVPTPVTAEVEQRSLRETLVLRSRVEGGDATAVVPVAPAGSVPVITALAVGLGDAVEEGELLLAVAGRPVVALALPVPLYRDLVPGLLGADVAAAQAALRRLGHRIPAREDGRFGAASQAAVADHWRALGYDPATTGPEAAAALQAARDAASAAAAEVDAALATDPPALPGAQRRYDDARAAAAAAQDAVGVILPRTEVASVPAVPAVITAVAVGLGQVAPDGAAALQLASSGLVLRAAVEPGQATLLREGMTGTVFGPDDAELSAVTVERVAPPAAGGEGDPVLEITLRSEVPLDAALLGADLRLEVELVPGSATPVLAVPVIAVREDGDDRYVRRRAAGGDVDTVRVEVGVVAGGWVEVRSSEPELAVGDHVVVG